MYLCGFCENAYDAEDLSWNNKTEQWVCELCKPRYKDDKQEIKLNKYLSSAHPLTKIEDLGPLTDIPDGERTYSIVHNDCRIVNFIHRKSDGLEVLFKKASDAIMAINAFAEKSKFSK